MFGNILEFLVLGILGAATIGGVIVGRRMIGGLSLRLKLDGMKVKTELQVVEHQMKLVEHQHNTTMLALASGAESDSQELAVFGKSDIQEPKESPRAQYAHDRMKSNAEEAKVF